MFVILTILKEEKLQVVPFFIVLAIEDYGHPSSQKLNLKITNRLSWGDNVKLILGEIKIFHNHAIKSELVQCAADKQKYMCGCATLNGYGLDDKSGYQQNESARRREALASTCVQL